jgi:hypothetical protein
VLALWIGNFPVRPGLLALSDSDRHPQFSFQFLEHWWQNEFVLGLFVVVFRVTVVLCTYRVLDLFLVRFRIW